MPGPVVPRERLYPVPWLDPESASVLDPAWKTAARTVATKFGLNDPQAAVMGMAGELPAGPATGGLMGMLREKVFAPIKAYHGSPHDFDRFDISKIGEGQGAQSYGHGLYFAEHEPVAADYRRTLTRGNDRLVEGGGRLPDWVAAKAEAAQQGTPGISHSLDDLIADFKARLGEAEERVASRAPQYWNDQDRIPGFQDVLRGLENVKQGAQIKPAGRMYEVAIHANPEHLLDWDRSLREQSPHVQQALERVGARPSEDVLTWRAHQITPADKVALRFGPSAQAGEWTAVQTNARGEIRAHTGTTYGTENAAQANALARNRPDLQRDPTKGSALYEGLADRFRKPWGVPSANVTVPAPAAASAALRDAGIPGLKYLDQGSRVKGEGTRNIVTFDDKDIEILRKFGLLLPAAGAAGAGAAQASRPSLRDQTLEALQ